jgi:hypothetical protein
MTIFSANSASFNALTVTSDITASNALITGTATVRELKTLLVTSSIIFESGSTKFGDSSDDTHQFTGSLSVLGNVSSSIGFSGSGANITNVPNSGLVNSSVTVNGTAISLGGSGTVTAAAGTLSGTTLASGVTTSSLTQIGTLTNGAVPASLVTAGTFGAGAYTFPSTLNVTENFSVATTKFQVNATTGAIIGNVVANSDWALAVDNSGTTNAHGPLFTIGASSTGIAFRVTKTGSAFSYLNITNTGVVEIGGAATIGSSLAITGALSGVTNLGMNGVLTIGTVSTNTYHALKRDAISTEHMFLWETGGSPHWYLGQRANLGNDFHLFSAGLGADAIRVTLATGAVSLGGPLAINGAFTGATTGVFSGNVGIGTTDPAGLLHVANLTSNNSAYQHIHFLSVNNNVEATGESYSSSSPSFGIAFRRQWTSGTFTNLAGIYGFGSSGWRGGLLFRTKNNTTPTGEPDIDALYLSPAGNVGIGTTSPAAKLDVNGSIQLRDPLSAGPFGVLSITNATFDGGTNIISAFNSTNLELKAAGAANIIKFTIESTERARITAGGYFKASNDGIYRNSTGAFHEMKTNATGPSLIVGNTSATANSDIFAVTADRNTTDNTFYAIVYYNDGAGAHRFRVADSGNVTNTNNSYGSLSDVKLKQDITDAASQWDDLKAVRFRKYRLKADVAEKGDDAKYMLGVIAQELREVSPGLVDSHPDTEQVEVEVEVEKSRPVMHEVEEVVTDAKGVESVVMKSVPMLDEDGKEMTETYTETETRTETRKTGTETLGVKHSILLMKAAVALQEAMARIESLEARLNALEN